MKEEELRSLLRSLPRERASDGFTDEVLSRLDLARPFYRQPRYALAAGLVLVAAGWFGAGRWQEVRQAEQTRQRIQALRTELEQLQSSVTLLRDLAPVLYLGGDEDVDLVIDMRHLVSSERGEPAQPVYYDDLSRMRKGETER
jgi:hypothetical protein